MDKQSLICYYYFVLTKVRGTGKVVANGSNKVKAKGTVTIAKVMVKTGAEVKTGDILFVLGAGDSAELEAAKEKLYSLEASYNAAVAGAGGSLHSYDSVKLGSLQAKKDAAEIARNEARLLWEATSSATEEQRKEAEAKVDTAKEALKTAQTAADLKLAELNANVKIAYDELQKLIETMPPEAPEIAAAKENVLTGLKKQSSKSSGRPLITSMPIRWILILRNLYRSQLRIWDKHFVRSPL